MYKESPIQLVSVDSLSGQYQVEEEALAYIRKIPPPIGIVTVAGVYRTGKSYLINRMLLNRAKGFGVGSTINACTKGLWIWGTPVKGTTADGESVNVLVVDTEGIGSLEEDQTHDSRIFSLAILLGSTFIYNSTGSIDENALQQLSFVVNLTKHIHLRSAEGQETDPEEIAAYFPTFYWIVRDFTLQLVDCENNPITSKEYLEKALATQKGSSQDTEEKNRIRRHLSAFFRDRDCFTMVRPVTDQRKLQTLDGMEIAELRHEFAEQVMNLRRRVLGKIKPKTLNGKRLSGEMFGVLCKQYVRAINDGAVPNIESAWNYMCKEQCQKAIAESLQSFDKALKDSVWNKLPMSSEELKSVCRKQRQVCFESFRKKAIGEGSQGFLKELEDRVRTIVQQLKAQNQKDGKVANEAFVKRDFSGIEKKMKTGVYKTFGQFFTELKAFYQHCLENGPKTPNRKTIYLDFMYKVIPQASQYFITGVEQDLGQAKEAVAELNSKVERTKLELKEQLAKETSSLSAKLSQAETAKVQLQYSLDKLQLEFNTAKSSNEKSLGTMQKQLAAKEAQFQRLKGENGRRIAEMEESIREKDRLKMLSCSEFDKERALLQQQIEQLTVKLEESLRKERVNQSTINSLRNESTLQLKESKIGFDRKLSEINLELRTANEKIGELGQQLKEAREEFESSKEKWSGKETKYRGDLAAKTKELEECKASLQLEMSKLESRLEQERERISIENRSMAQTSRNNEVTVKRLTDELKSLNSTFNKEKSRLEQSLECAQMELSSLRDQYDNDKMSMEKLIAALEESNTREREEAVQLKMSEMRDQFGIELRKVNMDHDRKFREAHFELEKSRSTIHELENELRDKTSDWKETQDRLEEELARATSSEEYLKRQNETLTRESEFALGDCSKNYQSQIRKLEDDLERVKTEAEDEMAKAREMWGQTLNQMKKHFENQIEEMEQKALGEKQRREDYWSSQISEAEARHQEEYGALNQQADALREQNLEMNNFMSNQINLLEQNVNIKNRHIESLEKNLTELKEQSEKSAREHQALLDSTKAELRHERDTLGEKIDQLGRKNNLLEKEIVSLVNLRDSLEKGLEGRDGSLAALRKELDESKEQSEKRIEELRLRLQGVTDELMEKKIAFEKDIALSTQKNEFYSHRSEELQRQKLEVVQQCEEKLRANKREIMEEANQKVEKAEAEREALVAKYDKLKRSSKENESQLQKDIIELGKVKAISEQKITSYEARLQELERKLVEEQKRFQEQMEQFKEQTGKEKKALTAQLSEVAEKLSSCEREMAETQKDAENQITMLRTKNQFFEKRYNQDKKRNETLHSEFNLRVDKVAKKKESQRASMEASYKETISQLQNESQLKINQLSEALTKKVTEYDEKVKFYEKEIKGYREKEQNDKDKKSSAQSLIEKKVNELQENERRLTAELDRLKNDRDSRTMDFQKQLDSEKENSRSKIKALEDKLKEAENKKNAQLIEMESEKFKIISDRNYYKNNCRDLEDKISQLEKAKERLLVENERNKNERKSVMRNQSYSSVLSQSKQWNSSQAESSAKKAGGFTDYSLFSTAQTEEDKENLEKLSLFQRIAEPAPQ